VIARAADRARGSRYTATRTANLIFLLACSCQSSPSSCTIKRFDRLRLTSCTTYAHRACRLAVVTRLVSAASTSAARLRMPHRPRLGAARTPFVAVHKGKPSSCWRVATEFSLPNQLTAVLATRCPNTFFAGCGIAGHRAPLDHKPKEDRPRCTSTIDLAQMGRRSNCS